MTTINSFSTIASVPRLAALGLFFCLAGCAPFGPYYHRPKIETPAAYKEQGSTETTAGWKPANPSDAIPRDQWWELFADSRLNDLEQKLIAANQSVKQAEAQFREASALVGFNRAGYFPTITTQPSVTRSAGPNAGRSPAGAPITASNLYTLPVTASWEPDLWGQNALSVRNAAATAQASAADLENMRLSMEAELASDYFSVEELDMEIAILTAAVSDDQESLQLTEARFNGGVASEADVAQAKTQLDSLRAQVTDLAIARAQFEHAIAVLTGQMPSVFSLSTGAISGVPPVIPSGVPSELLERRPDIASTERLVAAANANVGLARTAYFPVLSLTATGGFAAIDSASWLTWPSRFWSIGASAAETLFDFGRRRARRRQAWAAYDSAVAAYRQTVLTGFQEVEDSLAALRLLSQESTSQDSAVKWALKSLELENARYKSGLVSFLDVITTQNIALDDERSAAQVRGRQMTAAVSLIRTLGGGWNASQLSSPGATPPRNKADETKPK